MSCQIHIDSSDAVAIAKIKQICSIDLATTLHNNNGKRNIGGSTALYISQQTYHGITPTTTMRVPLGLGVEELGGLRPQRTAFTSMALSENEVSPWKFDGTLRTEQQVVVDDAKRRLNANASALVGCRVGYGKCLGLGTEVMLACGGIVRVEDISVGDHLMGDDGTQRTVTGIARGRERMCRIRMPSFDSVGGQSFRCNLSHILSLRLVNHVVITAAPPRGERVDCKVEFIDAKTLVEVSATFEDIRRAYRFVDNAMEHYVDIEVTEYLRLLSERPEVASRLHAYRSSGITRFARCTETCMCARAGRQRLPESESGRRRRLLELVPQLAVEAEVLVEGGAQHVEEVVRICGSLGIAVRVDRSGSTRVYANEDVTSEILVDVDVGVDVGAEWDYYGFELAGPNRRFLLGDFMVAHNTVIAWALCSIVALPTLLLTTRPMLCLQGLEAASVLLPHSNPLFLKASRTKPIPASAMILACNAANLPKLMVRFPELLLRAGLVILDEAHLLFTEKLAHGLLLLRPRYLVGLTATPMRYDAMDAAFRLFFGKTAVIVRELVQAHDVFLVPTGYASPFPQTAAGRLDWTQVLTLQAECLSRNALVARIAYSEASLGRTVLVLCKRRYQVDTVIALIEAACTPAGGAATTSVGSIARYTGDERDFDRSASVVVATVAKAGTGFDFSALNTLVLAADVDRYFIQALGRVFRTPETKPRIFDLQDGPPFTTHAKRRQRVYMDCGGTFLPTPQFM